MIYYFAMLLIPIIASFSKQRTGAKRDFALVSYFILLLFFVGLRDQVGPDWQAYENNFVMATSVPWEDIFKQREPGFFVLNKVSSVLGWGVYGVNFLCAILFLSGIFMYARGTANAWLAIATVVPYLVFIVGMSGIRQSAAIGMMFLMLSLWRKTGALSKVALILFAMSIHSSAILLFVFLIVRNDRYLLLRLLIAGVIMFVSASAIIESASFARYSRTYVEQNVESVGALVQVALSTFPAALYLVFRRKIHSFCGRNQQVELGVVLALVALFLVPISTTGVSRAALYLSFVQMWVYPAFVCANGKNRVFATFAVGMVPVVVFLVYFLFGTHASAFLPYRFVFM